MTLCVWLFKCVIDFCLFQTALACFSFIEIISGCNSTNGANNYSKSNFGRVTHKYIFHDSYSL